MKYIDRLLVWLTADNDNVENAVAFCTGDALATIMAINLLSDVAWPIVLSVITGFLGGAFAILGKMLIKWIFRDKKK